jgi:hypothetical protein
MPRATVCSTILRVPGSARGVEFGYDGFALWNYDHDVLNHDERSAARPIPKLRLTKSAHD